MNAKKETDNGGLMHGDCNPAHGESGPAHDERDSLHVECEHAHAAAGGAGACCSCRHKDTERSKEFQADIQKRLNRAIGQLNGVKAMIEDNRYCGDVLTQLAAAESAVHRTAELILQDHMETCVVEQVRAGNVEVVDEAMKLIRKFM